MKKALVTILATLTCLPAMAAEEVNIYSFRQPFLIQPILDDFTKQTGIKTNVVFAKKGLI
ncbi:iron ABC transporter substrate-binding protein, partial [Pseudoalteromonas sp. S3178]